LRGHHTPLWRRHASSTHGNTIGGTAVGVLACIALASRSYFVIERPFLALKRRFEPAAAAARPTHPSPAVAAAIGDR